MTFRAPEEISKGYESAEVDVISGLTPKYRDKGLEVFANLVESYGPIIQNYPCWHPFVWDVRDLKATPYRSIPGIDQNEGCVFLKDAILVSVAQEKVKDIVKAVADRSKQGPRDSMLITGVLKTKLFNRKNPTLTITCSYRKKLTKGSIIALMLERTLPERHNKNSQVYYPHWEYMRPLLLGEPHGKRSSLFVGESIGQAIKTVWKALTETAEIF